MAREDEIEICARIKQARKEAGLSQKLMAERLDVELRTYQNYESNRVPWRLLKKIGRITSRTQDWLLYGDRPDESQLDRMEAKLDQILAALSPPAAAEAAPQTPSRPPGQPPQVTTGARPSRRRKAN